ncbi:aminotransferase class III-fold pyridoxal phosphate-dependent enzyme [Halobacteria archaeon AArc-m2/3/4]|uniref:Glutamate-1-semialdehyde 2,1-aminomutase n=1 Tax=Natronoglomus mannanivorans TaxID=2979990 RepID=A0AAP2Z2L9_9EURY|nr:aminotransferase class III-fold pyridoxal phosphate-dependent enzyme [Halobacteria archaeon AArc-xg1-1]MCU4973786.1 aminotransferase class III-fold pyridoxal phosphate-dependent enzyme [Halobacteria archaeon AArc-m2/3/4]
MSRGLPTVSSDRTIDRSEALVDRASELVPGISQTGSKTPTQFVQGVSPTHIERAKGSRLWDVDGNEYVDCNAALGPILLGHNYPAVTEAVTEQLQDGTMFTMEHPLHVEVAELLAEVVPCAEMVKFAKSGNDVTTLAAKVARAHTGRDVIATQGYHGWPDVWMADNENLNAGIPDAVGDYTESFEYNDIESVERIFEDHPDDVAAIVTTPVNLEEPEDGFLEELRDLADREGAVLVFDEVLTGFRFAIGGAQEYFGVTPDLACFAKAMANGYPISALAGSREVMGVMNDDDFFYSMTYAGDAASLAAAKAAITVQREEDVHGHIAEKGAALMEGYNDLAAELELADVTRAEGFPARFSIGFDDDIGTGAPTEDEDGSGGRLVRSLFMQEAHRRGVLYTGSHLPTYSHTDQDVEFTLEVYRECLEVVSEALEAGDVAERLEGDLVGATLRERTGEND